MRVPSPRFIPARPILGAEVSVAPRITTCRASGEKPIDRAWPCAARIASAPNQFPLPRSQRTLQFPQPPSSMSMMSCREPPLLLTPYVCIPARMGVKPSRFISPLTPEYQRKSFDMANRVDYRSSRPARLPCADHFARGRYPAALRY